MSAEQMKQRMVEAATGARRQAASAMNIEAQNTGESLVSKGKRLGKSLYQRVVGAFAANKGKLKALMIKTKQDILDSKQPANPVLQPPPDILPPGIRTIKNQLDPQADKVWTAHQKGMKLFPTTVVPSKDWDKLPTGEENQMNYALYKAKKYREILKTLPPEQKRTVSRMINDNFGSIYDFALKSTNAPGSIMDPGLKELMVLSDQNIYAKSPEDWDKDYLRAQEHVDREILTATKRVRQKQKDWATNQSQDPAGLREYPMMELTTNWNDRPQDLLILGPWDLEQVYRARADYARLISDQGEQFFNQTGPQYRDLTVAQQLIDAARAYYRDKGEAAPIGFVSAVNAFFAYLSQGGQQRYVIAKLIEAIDLLRRQAITTHGLANKAIMETEQAYKELEPLKMQYQQAVARITDQEQEYHKQTTDFMDLLKKQEEAIKKSTEIIDNPYSFEALKQLFPELENWSGSKEAEDILVYLGETIKKKVAYDQSNWLVKILKNYWQEAALVGAGGLGMAITQSLLGQTPGENVVSINQRDDIQQPTPLRTTKFGPDLTGKNKPWEEVQLELMNIIEKTDDPEAEKMLNTLEWQEHVIYNKDGKYPAALKLIAHMASYGPIYKSYLDQRKYELKGIFKPNPGDSDDEDGGVYTEQDFQNLQIPLPKDPAKFQKQWKNVKFSKSFLETGIVPEKLQAKHRIGLPPQKDLSNLYSFSMGYAAPIGSVNDRPSISQYTKMSIDDVIANMYGPNKQKYSFSFRKPT